MLLDYITNVKVCCVIHFKHSTLTIQIQARNNIMCRLFKVAIDNCKLKSFGRW